MSEMGTMLEDSANRVFGDLCVRNMMEAAEQGEWPEALWTAVEEVGFTGALTPESAGGMGLPFEDAMLIVRSAARSAAPVPLVETMMAGWLLGSAGLQVPEGPLSVAPVREADGFTLQRDGDGWRLEGTARRIPWARNATHLALIAEADGVSHVVCVPVSSLEVAHERNIAYEPRDTVTVTALRVPAQSVAAAGDMTRERLFAFGAMVRTVQIAGALDRVLDLSVQFAQDRVQFGKPIGKFQAIQHALAVLAGHAAAATAASHLAIEAAPGFGDVAVGAAKARAGEAASVAAAIAHQTHGAMGTTHEHMLHFSTRRLWAWRSEFGNDTHWSRIVGRAALAAGGDEFWSQIITA